MSIISVDKTDVVKARKFLQTKLAEVLGRDIYEELEIVLSEVRTNKTPNYLNTAFSKAVRLFGKGDLGYSAAERSTANRICNSWTPPKTIDKAVRMLILLNMPNENETDYLRSIESLFDSADLGEQVVIYSALALLEYPEKLIPRCLEGIRSNMGEVFEAVANENPFPASHLSEEAFNQMVLKCLFVGKPLYKVENLHHRVNRNLSRMAFDYAHERWAAGRDLNPEIWQLTEGFLEPENMVDMYRLSRSENELERKAAAICCSQCQITQAEEIYAMSEYQVKVESGELNWFDIGYEVYNK